MCNFYSRKSITLLRKDLKLRGCIGDPNVNQKDQLSFVSVKHQIYKAQRQSYTEDEIVNSVIRSMHSGLRLKSILEMKSNLTLAILIGYLQNHYKETTDLCAQFTSITQIPNEDRLILF